MRHGLNESRFAAACWPLEQDRQTLVERRPEDLFFIASGNVVRSRIIFVLKVFESIMNIALL